MFRKLLINLFLFSFFAITVQVSPASAQTVQTSTNTIFNVDLSLGTTIADVLNLQRVLNGDPATKLSVASGSTGSLGYETTYFGPATKDAVMRFQAKYGLPQTAKADQATRHQLDVVATAFGIQPIATPTQASTGSIGTSQNTGASSDGSAGSGSTNVSEIAVFLKDLQIGMNDSDVLILQRVLNIDPATALAVSAGSTGSLGYETTYFGPATKDAVMRFQQKYSLLPVAGYVGQKTRAVLNNIAVLRYKEVFWGSIGTSVAYQQNIQAAPFVDVKVNGGDNPFAVAIGTNVTITWVAGNVTQCVSGAGITRPFSGSLVMNVTESNTVEVTCRNANGVTVTDSIQVIALTNTNTNSASASVDLKINSLDGTISVASGTAVSIAWVSQNVSNCSIGSDTGVFQQTFPSQIQYYGSLQGTAIKSGSVRVSCTSSQGGNVTDSVYLAVTNTVTPQAGPSPVNPGFNPTIPTVSNQYIGYGVVNWWSQINPVQLASDLKTAGLNFTQIEYLGPSNPSNGLTVPGSAQEQTVLRPLLKQFVLAMRAQGITTMITVANWNAPYISTNSSAFYTSIVDYIKSDIGTDKVILEPISERNRQSSGQTTPDQTISNAVLAYAGSAWTGDMSWSVMGSSDIVPARYLVGDYHFSSVTSDRSNNPGAGKITLASTDNGSILAELGSTGSKTDQTFDPVKIKSWACTNIKKGYSVMTYGYWHQKIDTGTITALGQVAKEGVNCTEDVAVTALPETGVPIIVWFSGVVVEPAPHACKTLAEGKPNTNNYTEIVVAGCGADPVVPGWTKPGQQASFFKWSGSSGAMPKVGDVVTGYAEQDHWTICEETAKTSGSQAGTNNSSGTVQPVGHIKQISSAEVDTTGQCKVTSSTLASSGASGPSANGSTMGPSIVSLIGPKTIATLIAGPAGWITADTIQNLLKGNASVTGGAGVGFVVGGAIGLAGGPVGAIVGAGVGAVVGDAISHVGKVFKKLF